MYFTEARPIYNQKRGNEKYFDHKEETLLVPAEVKYQTREDQVMNFLIRLSRLHRICFCELVHLYNLLGLWISHSTIKVTKTPSSKADIYFGTTVSGCPTNKTQPKGNWSWKLRFLKNPASVVQKRWLLKAHCKSSFLTPRLWHPHFPWEYVILHCSHRIVDFLANQAK